MYVNATRLLILLLAGILILIPAASGLVNSPVCTDPAVQNHVTIDGTRIAWDDSRNGIGNVYMSDITTGVETQITTDVSSYPDISGTRIVWQGPTSYGYGPYWIRMKDLSTGIQTTIVSDEWGVYVPTISGNYVAYNRFTEFSDTVDLYDISTGTTTTSIFGSDDMSDERLRSGSPISGNYLVWKVVSTGDSGLWLYNIATKEKMEIRRLADIPDPDISGNYVVYEDVLYDDAGIPNCDIFLYNIATGVERRITTNPGVQRHPAISGNRIVWEDYRNGNWDIYAYDLSTGVETQVTTDPGTQTRPAVSGNRVVWEDDRNGNWDIYMAELEEDTTAPVTTAVIDPSAPNGDNGWYTSDVTVTLTATDDGDVAKTMYQVFYYDDVGFDPDVWYEYTDSLTFGGTCWLEVYYYSVDNAGNIEEAQHTGWLNIDEDAPTITLSVPEDNGVYAIGEAVLADWDVDDEQPTSDYPFVPSAVGTVPSGQAIDTSSAGPKTFTVTATDNAGNTATVTRHYTVGYAYTPVTPASTKVTQIKLGSSMPVRIVLKDASGNLITNAVVRLYVAKEISPGVWDTEMQASSLTNPKDDNRFRYDPQKGQYVFNLDTRNLGVGTWQLRAKLDDGTTQVMTIKITK